MSLKSQIEALIYAAEEPVTIEQMATVLKSSIAVEPPAEGEDKQKSENAQVRTAIRAALDELANDYALSDRGMEIRQVAGGYRMSTKPEHHDVVRAFARSLKPPVRLSLQALETLAVIAYKQPVTVPEISEIRGVDSGGVIATLLDRKLITTAGRKAVIGRPILYKTTKDFLLRFGLKDVSELPSIEEFEKLAAVEPPQGEIFGSVSDATGVSSTEAAEEPAEPAQEAVPDDDEPVFASMADDHDEGSVEEPEPEPSPDEFVRN
jgi:segregation and condensation protein B